MAGATLRAAVIRASPPTINGNHPTITKDITMKKFLFILTTAALILIAASSSDAQRPSTVQNTKAFASSTSDTAYFPHSAVEFQSITDYFVFNDSVKADVVYEIEYFGNTTWTSAYTDSIIHQTTGKKYQEIILRNNTTERLSGNAFDIRRRVTFRSGSVNGVTSATYSETLYARR